VPEWRHFQKPMCGLPTEARPMESGAVQAEHSLELHMPFIAHVFRQVCSLEYSALLPPCTM
jgi:predicted class III extradiol MEMO1 family dioxygenase